MLNPAFRRFLQRRLDALAFTLRDGISGELGAFNTLAQADKYDTDQIYKGLVEEIIKASPIPTLFPFDSVLGNALAYNRELALPTGSGFRAIGATWDESTHTETNVRTTLTIVGGDADMDKFLTATHARTQDIEALTIAEKAKAVWQQFENELIYGPSTDGFNGWHALIGSGAQQVNQGSGSTPAAGTFFNLDAMIDLVKPGKPDCLVMSRRTRRAMNAFARTNSTFISTQRLNDFGQMIQFYNDIPIFVSDFASDVEVIASGRFSAKTGGASSTVFALQFGLNALHGISSEGSDIIQNDLIDPLETKDARRNRIKMYAAQALKCTQAIARLDGLSSSTFTN